MYHRYRPRRPVLGPAVAVGALVVSACAAGGSGEGSSTVAATTAPPAAATFDCTGVTGLASVSDALAAGDARCDEWIESALGRSVMGSTGSVSLWSRATPYGTALVVGAVHTLGEGWFGPSGAPIEAAVDDPRDQIGVLRLFLVRPDGSGPDDLASPLYLLYHPAIAADRNGNRMQDVLPVEDFFVGVTDGQKFDVSGPIPTPDPITSGPVPLYDPASATTAGETHGGVVGGETVLLLGYPNDTRLPAVAVGRVLTDAEAVEVVAALAELGDPEGTIPYDPDVEMIVEGVAAAGMSGGPVVDPSGRLVGVMVRATGDPAVVRAVRMEYVVAQLHAAVAGLPESERAELAVFLEG